MVLSNTSLPSTVSVQLLPFSSSFCTFSVFFEIPQGYEIQVRPRSGLAAKYGITVLNTPGTIDSDYRGELKIILINLGKDAFVVKNGERIAQIIVSPVTLADFTITDSLSVTNRGEKGFGSTGVYRCLNLLN